MRYVHYHLYIYLVVLLTKLLYFQAVKLYELTNDAKENTKRTIIQENQSYSETKNLYTSETALRIVQCLIHT